MSFPQKRAVLQSHTQNHVRLLQSDAPTAMDEVTRDKAAPERPLAAPEYCCYPYGEDAVQHVAMRGKQFSNPSHDTLRTRHRERYWFI